MAAVAAGTGLTPDQLARNALHRRAIVLFRFYGPEKSLFEKKTWRLPDMAKV